jgi:hypothetical protein
MLFRPVREFLDEAMKEVKEFDNPVDLNQYLGLPLDAVLEYKPQGFDKRIGWNSFLVSYNGVAVGHSNSNMEAK